MRKRALAFALSALAALGAFSGCSDRAKLEYDTIENVRKGIDDALSKSYEHITIAEGISIAIPDELYTYEPQGAVLVGIHSLTGQLLCITENIKKS